MKKPTITFKVSRKIIYVNTICLKKLQDIYYVNILVCPCEKRLVLRPCNEHDKGAVHLRPLSGNLVPRRIICEDLILKIASFMGWGQGDCHRFTGHLANYNNEEIMLFELKGGSHG
jgi:hypothetical protein